MDEKRRKQLISEYKNRTAEMGVISLYSTVNKEGFLGISKDTTADLNSHRFKLNANWHGNKELQALWNIEGEKAFELKVVQVLEAEDPNADPTEELNDLLTSCLKTIKASRRI